MQEECTHGRIKQARSNAATEWTLLLSAATQLDEAEWEMLVDVHDGVDLELCRKLGQADLDKLRELHRRLMAWAMLTLKAAREQQKTLRSGVAA